MNPSDPPDDLDRLLREAPPLPDDGFSRRVLASLPPRRTRDFAGLRRTLLCLAGAAVGLLLARDHGSLPPTLPSVVEATHSLAGQIDRLVVSAERGIALLAGQGPTVLSLAVALGAALFAFASGAADSAPPRPVARMAGQ